MTRTAKATAAAAKAHTKPAPRGLPARVREARQRSGKSLRELARATGLSASTLSNIERGTVKPLAVLEALAKALAVMPCWLAYGDDIQP